MTKNHSFDWNGGRYYKIEPYFANLALTGLLASPTTANILVVRNWLGWYFDHLNFPDYNGLKGTVYDYYADINGTGEHSSSEYDSTDSYAATTLTLLKKYYDVSNDSQYLIDNQFKIELIAQALLATQQPDGLTFAKPDYPIKYLMDNTEVSEGLDSIAFLERYLFADIGKANFYSARRAATQIGIEKLWNATNNNYDVYENSRSGWNTFYPDATCQLFPIWTGSINGDSTRARELYDQFNHAFPTWPALSTPDSFPWAIICFSGAKMHDSVRVDSFLDSVKTKYIDTGHPWPWYNMEAGFTINTAIIMSADYTLGKDYPHPVHER